MRRARAPRLAPAVLALAALALAACGDDGGADDGADAGPDAAAILCDLPAPGSRCTSTTTLERCDGDQVATVDCAAGGGLCGPDRGGSGGAECLATGDACGTIAYTGACSGDVLAYCDNGSLVVSDCGVSFGECLYQSADVGFNCTTPCALMNVSPEGTCVAGAIQRCVFVDGGYTVVNDACPVGTACGKNAETDGVACLPTGACASVGPAGRCDGDTLTSCVAGQPTTTDCAAGGAVCAWGGTGYVCADPGATGAFAVSGTIRYQDRPPLASGGLGAYGEKPARGVAVAVLTEAGETLAAGVTSDDGSYTLRYDAPANAMVHVLAATVSTSSARPIRVLRPDGLAHGFGGPSFAPAAASTQDLLVTDASGAAPAFNIFDETVSTMTTIATVLEDPTPEPIVLVWVRGTENGTYYIDLLNAVYLLGAPSDEDGYDDTVILHETGHYVEDTQGKSNSPGGAHDGSPADPRLAWSEGFATYWATAVRGHPLYADSNAAGGWSQDVDTDLTLANAGGAMTQNVSENMVTEILWDTGDEGAADDDGSPGGHGPVLRVQRDYLRSASLADRGVKGVDLVDWLDGWFRAAGTGGCAALREIVTTKRKFPYDYNWLVGSCP